MTKRSEMRQFPCGVRCSKKLATRENREQRKERGGSAARLLPQTCAAARQMPDESHAARHSRVFVPCGQAVSFRFDRRSSLGPKSNGNVMRQKASVLKLEGRQSEQEIRNAFLAQITAKCALCSRGLNASAAQPKESTVLRACP